jgi:hypothetical protein
MSFLQLRTPSFRSRLRLFFVVIVVVPMITMAVVLFQLIVASERSRTDARLSQAQAVSQEVLREQQAEAGEAAEVIGRDQGLADAREAGDRNAIQDRLDRLAETTEAHYVRLRLNSLGSFEAGELPAVAPADRRLVDERERPTGRLTVSMLSPDEYAERIFNLTGADVVISRSEDRVAATRPDAPAELPD